MPRRKPTQTVHLQIDRQRQYGAAAVTVIQCVRQTPAWSRHHGPHAEVEFRCGSGGARLILRGTNEAVRSTLLHLQSLAFVAYHLGFKSRKLEERLGFVYDQVLRHEHETFLSF